MLGSRMKHSVAVDEEVRPKLDPRVGQDNTEGSVSGMPQFADKPYRDIIIETWRVKGALEENLCLNFPSVCCGHHHQQFFVSARY